MKKNSLIEARRKKIMLSVIVLLGLFFINFTSANLWNDNTLVAYYSFDTEYNFTSLTYLHNLTANGTTYTTSGKLGEARDFERDTLDFLNTTDTLGNLTSMTICMWIKQENITSRHFLFGRETHVNQYGDILENNSLEFASAGGNTTYSDIEVARNTNWQYICFSGNETNVYLYINGTKVADSTNVVDGYNDSYILGMYGGYVANSFDGIMDEVGIWNRTLTDIEILDLYNAGDGLLYGFLSIKINYPTNTTYYLPDIKFINYTTEANDSCWYSLNEGVTNSSLVNAGTNFSFTPNPNENHLKVFCNDTLNNLYLSEKYFIAKLILNNSNNYNTTSYETSYETFVLNISYNSSLTAVALDYNGTLISSTLSGGLWTSTYSVPSSKIGTNQLRWKYTYAGGTLYSENFTQTVSPILFGQCNATITQMYLNLSFKDESDLSVINASIPYSTFTYYLGNGTTNKTYTFTNVSNNWNYTFCFTPVTKNISVIPYVQYKQGTEYPQRIWNPTVQTYTNSSTNQTLYLLGSANGIYVTIQVVNVADQTISGVDVNVTRSISGSDYIVGTGTTGSDGSVTFWLNPDFTHTFSFSKTGYTTYTTSFLPTQTSYTVTLGEGTTYVDSYFRGISYTLTPINTSLVNDTIYSFGILLNSTYWDLDEVGFNLRLKNGTIITGGTTTSNATQVSVNYNTTNQTVIYMDYFWKVNGTYTNVTKGWIVYNTDNTQWSIKNFIDDLKAYMDTEMFGLDNFGRYLIIFLVMFLTIGIMSYKYGFTSPMVVLTMIFLIVFFFDVVLDIIPALSFGSGREIPNLLTFLSGAILAIYILMEGGK